MKKILIILFAITFLTPRTVFAAPTPTNSSIPSGEAIQKINEKVDQLKDKVASRVAQLKLVEKRGIIGTVESVSDTQITVTDLNENRRIIDVDEFTKFSSSDNNSFGISDIKKGSKISTLGLYNKESERLLARFVNEVTIPLFLHGVITKIDKENFTVTLSTQDGTDYLVDIEKLTKLSTYNDGQLEVSGFSKTEVLQNAIVLCFPDPKEKNRVTASRVITFPNVPKDPRVPINEDKPIISPTPTGAEEK